MSKFTWINWGRNQAANPRKIWSPKNLDELKTIIQNARENKINVHAYGAGHSWSNLVPTSGYLINTSHLNRLLEVDREKKQVRIEAGMPLHQLNDVLKEHGLALSNLGRVTVQSIAGATATGTHGTGHTPTLASFITQVELLASDGTLHTITADKNPEWLAAARLSLGSLGIIYALKLQCEPRFTLEDNCYITNFDDAYQNYQKMLQEHDYWMFEWNPYTDKALVYAWDRTDLPPTNNTWKPFLNAIKEGTFDLISKLSQPFSHITPKLVDLRFRFTSQNPFRSESYQVLTRPYLGMRYVECEMSIKHEFLDRAVQELKNLFKEYQTQKIYVPRVTFRFVSKENGTLLSPTFDGERIFISLVMPAHSAFHLVFADYQKRMEAFNARPHWGKIHQMSPELAQKLYGENIEKFLQIRQTLDPEGLFMNDQVRSFSRNSL